MKSQPKIHKYTKQNDKLTKSAKKQKKSKGTVEEKSRNSRGATFPLLFLYFSFACPLLLCTSCQLSVVFCIFVDFRLIFHVFLLILCVFHFFVGFDCFLRVLCRFSLFSIDFH